MAARIILVPTPIGNLKDITLRAIEVLQTADRIAAEDTRHSGVLLKHLGIEKPFTSLHMHNEHSRVQHLVAEVLAMNQTLAVISDAGTPGISDPGFLIVREAIKQNVLVEVLPGATALVPALVASGLPMDRFTFEGFLPVKKGRQTRLQQLTDEPRTLVFYESPHKLLKTLSDFNTYFGADRAVVVARELTKLHEEIFRGTIQEALAHFSAKNIKGEIVLVVAGKNYTPQEHTETEAESEEVS